MAINISQAFHRTSANAVDETLTLTKAQMLTVNDNLMPSKYFTICQDDGAIYLYDKSATPSAETGKFTKFEGGSIQTDTIPTASSILVGVIVQYIGDTTSDYINGYFYKCSEDTSTTPSTYSWVNVKVQDGTISRDLSQSEYDALPDAEKNDGTVYYITDAVIFNPNTAVCGFTPIGTIISVMGNTAPKNYLACNGQVVNILTYPELANYFEEQFGSKNKFGGDGVTTFAMPDLRGEFLRGTGTNSHNTQGNGASVGTHQDSTELPNIGVSRSSSGGLGIYALDIPTTNNESDGPYIFDSVYNRYTSGKNAWFTATSEYSQSTVNGVFRVRPTNTSVLYCIAVRNIYVDARNDYSTDEKVVGTWIDGKPLYQKTIIGTMPNVTTDGTYVSTNIAHNIANIDLAFIKEAFVLDFADWPITSNLVRRLPYTTNAGYQLKVSIGRNIIQYASGLKTYNGSTVYTTIQYTKTTD